MTHLICILVHIPIYPISHQPNLSILHNKYFPYHISYVNGQTFQTMLENMETSVATKFYSSVGGSGGSHAKEVDDQVTHLPLDLVYIYPLRNPFLTPPFYRSQHTLICPPPSSPPFPSSPSFPSLLLLSLSILDK